MNQAKIWVARKEREAFAVAVTFGLVYAAIVAGALLQLAALAHA